MMEVFWVMNWAEVITDYLSRQKPQVWQESQLASSWVKAMACACFSNIFGGANMQKFFFSSYRSQSSYLLLFGDFRFSTTDIPNLYAVLFLASYVYLWRPRNGGAWVWWSHEGGTRLYFVSHAHVPALGYVKTWKETGRRFFSLFFP